MTASRWAMLTVLVVLLGADVSARADAFVPPTTPCPGTPRDGQGCGAFHVGRVCHHPGAICECRNVVVDGRTRRRWTCGEAGE